MEHDEIYDLNFWMKRMEAAEQDIVPENYKALKTHMKAIKLKQPNTRKNNLSVLIPFLKHIKKPAAELDEFEVDKYFDSLKYKKSTLRLHMVTIKTFLKIVNPICSNSIKPERTKSTLKKSDLLTMEEIEKLITAAGCAQDKAIISCLVDSGARISELMSTKIEDATFDTYGCKLWLRESKTFPRTVRLTYASGYLKRWLEEHPRRDEPDAPIFCSNFAPHNVPSRGALYHRLKEIHERSGIKKRINPHVFRKTRSSELAKKFHGNSHQMNSVLGWSPNSRQADVYISMDDDDIDDLMIDAAGIKKVAEEPEQPKIWKCWRCHEINPVSEPTCLKCDTGKEPPIVDERSVEDILMQKLADLGIIGGETKQKDNKKYID